MQNSARRRVIAAGVVAAILWLASGGVSAALRWNGILGDEVGAALPGTVPGSVWTRPGPWAVVAITVAAIGITAAVTALLVLLARREDGMPGVVPAWFAVVAAGALVGLAWDVSTIVASWPAPRLQMIFDGLGANAAVGAYWGLVHGWVPALIARHAPRPVTGARRGGGGLLAAATAFALVAVVAAGVGGERAARVESARQSALAEGFTQEQGALPDPYAEGTPPPTAVPAEGPRDPAWCTPEQAMPLFGETDAATGHRVLSIRLMNFAEVPCVIEGYLDVAFADQNGNELMVDVRRGSSFMATDPGPQRIEIPAGGYAIAYLGWDANSTVGALVASTLYVAPIPGDVRGSWPIESDIVEGSTVEVTAWELEGAPGAG